MNQEILRDFWSGNKGNLDELRVTIASDNDYEELIAEIYHDRQFIALIHIELGKEQPTLSFPDKQFSRLLREIDINWFLKAIVIACGTLFSGSYLPEDKDFSFPNAGALDKLRVTITDNSKYDHPISKIYHDGKYVALIHQEYGKSRTTLVFPEDDVPNVLREIDVNWFLKAVVIARDALIKDSTVPDIIEKPTSYEDKELS